MPWNQDLLNLYELASPIHQLEDFAIGLLCNTFIDKDYQHGCVTRNISQLDPASQSTTKIPADRVKRQHIVAAMHKGKKGLAPSLGKLVCLNQSVEPFGSDLMLSYSSKLHGVELFDPVKDVNNLDSQEKWSPVFAINKLYCNTKNGSIIVLRKHNEHA